MKLKSTAQPTYDTYALRGAFDGVTYFMTTLPLNQCVEQLHFENVNEVKSFRERMQRTLDESRAREIFEKYLRTNRLRFFNSLVAVMVPPPGETGGYFEFKPFTGENDKPLDFGLLKVLTDIQRVVVDGQHRLKALKHAAEYARTPEYDESLGLKEFKIPVVFLTFSGIGGDGFDQKYNGIYDKVTDKARKIFVDLNQNAKKADKKSLYILDDSDFSAVAARFMIESDQEFERYTRWHGNGAALSDSDHCRTTIEILNHFAEVLLPEGEEEQAARDYDLSNDAERNEAMSQKFVKGQAHLYGLAPNDVVSAFFTKLGFFATWPAKVEAILNSKPELQPAETSPNLAQKRALKDHRATSLLGTVVGQKVAFDAVLHSFVHMGRDTAELNLAEGLRRLNLLDSLGHYGRTAPLWQELLVRPGGKIKLTAQESSRKVLTNLLQLAEPETIAPLMDSWIADGEATPDTLAEYTAVVTGLRAAA